MLAIVLVTTAGVGPVLAQGGPNPSPLDVITPSPPLLTAVAPPTNLGDFVQDQTALLKLGKALFWDMQLGSDGIQACASCHFHAGADNREKNQVSPGLLATPRDILFDDNLGGGPNYQLTADNFPLRKLSDPNCRSDVDPAGTPQCPDGPSTVLSDTNDVISSQGVFNTVLNATVPGQAADDTTSVADPDGFQVGGINVRRCEPRNAPTVINAIFNKLQFWDGRAKEVFNGANIKGAADASVFVYKAPKPNTLVEVHIGLNNSSLASLVTGPPLSPFEMSADGRAHLEIGMKFLRRSGKKLTTMRPLAQQLVHPQDSVLGADSRFPQPGLKINSYDDLIKQAFKDEWWKANKNIQVNPDDGMRTIVQQHAVGQPLPENEFELRQWNFSLFAGLAMQKYMSTLVSDQTPFDKFQAGDTTALTEQEIRGLTTFVNPVGEIPNSEDENGEINRGGNCNGCHTIPEFTRASVRRADDGLIPNYGVRPADEDPGGGDSGTSKFKVPNLRNIALTAPYFHNGGMATLEQVVQFYNRGRDFNMPPPPQLPPQLGLSQTQQDDLVAFLRDGLTDPRVLNEKAPFDHPQLFVPDGHPGDETEVTDSGNTNGFPTATDALVEIPAVGQNGVANPPLNFLQ